MWREGLPVGNGFTGASLYGGSKQEILQLNRHDFWCNGKAQPLPDVKDALARQRRMMDEENFKEASWEIVNALREKEYESKLESHIPMARMLVTQEPVKGFKNFRRELDMEKALASQQWTDNGVPMRREVFVSRCEDVVVYRLCAGEEASYKLHLETYRNDGENDNDFMKELWESEEKENFAEENQPGWMFLHAEINKLGEKHPFGAVARVSLPRGGSFSKGKKALRITGAREVLIVISLYQGGEKEEQQKVHREKLERYAGRSFKELLSESARLHRKLYHSASLSFGAKWTHSNEELLLKAYAEDAQPTELVEKLWHFGRYLFICGSNPKANPFPLYGLWGGRYRPMWCHNMANENLQMIYWHSFVGNLGEYHQAVFKYLNDRIPAFRENARKLFGIDGIYLTAGTTPGVAEPTQVVPVIINWIGAAGWLAQHYYKYYRYTKDAEYAKEVMLPYLMGVADFYEAFLCFEDTPQGERLKIYPSVSPENTPQNFMPPAGVHMAHPMPTTINSTIDLAIVKEFFTNLLELWEKPSQGAGDRANTGRQVCTEMQTGTETQTDTEIQAVTEERLELWRRILQAIPPYEANGEGAIREWQDERFEDRYDHRHLSHIYPVFPGEECYALRTPEMESAFEKAVELRKIDAQTGWSMAHMAAIYARFRKGAQAMECLDNMAKSSLLPNFFTLHNDWRGMNISLNMDPAPVQLDAIMGYVNALQEMLVYTTPGYLALLPAPERRIMRGECKNFRYHDGFLSMKWDLEKGELFAQLRAVRAHKLTLVLPDVLRGAKLVLSDEANGEKIVLQKETNGNGFALLNGEKSNAKRIPQGVEITFADAGSCKLEIVV